MTPDEEDIYYYEARMFEEQSAAEAKEREAIAELDGGFKHEGEFIVPPQKSSARGPWSFFSTAMPFMSYIDRIWNWRQYRWRKQEAVYMEKLLDTKGESDTVLFDRVAEILRDVRGEPIWLRHYERFRDRLRSRYQRLRYVQWPAFRKTVGF